MDSRGSIQVGDGKNDSVDTKVMIQIGRGGSRDGRLRKGHEKHR